jgi:hypothetical protein
MRLEILSLQNTGPTDGTEDDTLWVAEVAEAGGAAEQVRFSLPARFGEPTDNEVREMIRRAIASLTLDEVRKREEPFGEDPYRRVIFLRP